MQMIVPYSKLRHWAGNPRPELDAAKFAELCASLEHKGQLQNLLAVPSKEEDGAFIVFAGKRRLSAFGELLKNSKIDADFGVKIDLRDIDIDDPEVLMMALAENVVREQMTPIDEYVAMAELVEKKVDERAIAAAFGYDVKKVRQRLALGRLPVESHAILRNNVRDLDWARALTMADKTTQKKICADVTNNPEAAWLNGSDIRRFLTSEAISQDNAIFDIAEYKGRIIYDMFGSNSLTDRSQFWDLQNAAVARKTGELEAQGWSKVEVSNVPVDTWAYKKTDDKTQAKCVIEVLPNGKVTVHEGLKIDAYVENLQTDKQTIDPIEDVDANDIPGGADGVPSSRAIIEYAAALRTALVQAELAKSMRKAIEVVVAGLIGHPEIGIRGQEYKTGLPGNIASAAPFAKVREIYRELRETFEDCGIDRTENILPALSRLSDEELNTLFCQIVATKIGQATTSTIDNKDTSLLNILGASFGIDIREHWTPDAGFLETMRGSDLRRIATALLPMANRKGIANAKRPMLIATIEDGFNDARNGVSSMDAAERMILNEWTPGPFQFPAFHDADRVVASPSDETSADEAIFGSIEEAESAVFDKP